jgi:hypothetical protein
MKSFRKVARAFLLAVKYRTDPYTSVKAVVNKIDDQTMQLSTPDHLQFAAFGRGPGKQPPLEKIMDFVVSKNIGDTLNQKGTAFAIAKSIAKYGTKNWVPGAPNLLEQTVIEQMPRYSQKLADAWKKDAEEMLRKEMESLKQDVKIKI